MTRGVFLGVRRATRAAAAASASRRAARASAPCRAPRRAGRRDSRRARRPRWRSPAPSGRTPRRGRAAPRASMPDHGVAGVRERRERRVEARSPVEHDGDEDAVVAVHARRAERLVRPRARCPCRPCRATRRGAARSRRRARGACSDSTSVTLSRPARASPASAAPSRTAGLSRGAARRCRTLDHGLGARRAARLSRRRSGPPAPGRRSESAEKRPPMDGGIEEGAAEAGLGGELARAACPGR